MITCDRIICIRQISDSRFFSIRYVVHSFTRSLSFVSLFTAQICLTNIRTDTHTHAHIAAGDCERMWVFPIGPYAHHTKHACESNDRRGKNPRMSTSYLTSSYHILIIDYIPLQFVLDCVYCAVLLTYVYASQSFRREQNNSSSDSIFFHIA